MAFRLQTSFKKIDSWSHYEYADFMAGYDSDPSWSTDFQVRLPPAGKSNSSKELLVQNDRVAKKAGQGGNWISILSSSKEHSSIQTLFYLHALKF